MRIHADNLMGSWESDWERTLWELQRTLGDSHPKTREYGSDTSRLILCYSTRETTYYFRDMVCTASHEILAEDEHSLVTRVVPCDLNEQRLWHLHFLDGRNYWVSVDLDWGLTYREFFRKLPDDFDHNQRIARAMETWRNPIPNHSVHRTAASPAPSDTPALPPAMPIRGGGR